jgi:poly(3-hydroxybutyrate) depolymerase
LLLLFLLSALALLITFLTLARRKPIPAANVDHPRLAPGISMQDVTFYSRALGRDIQYRVFLPPAHDKKLTVVYLLHGGGGTFRDWSNYSDVAQFVGGDLC